MKKLLLGLGSFVAAAAPVAAVVACGSSNSNTVHAGVDNGGNTGVTDGKPSDGSGVTTIPTLTQDMVDQKLATITEVDASGLSELKDYPPGEFVLPIKTLIQSKIPADLVGYTVNNGILLKQDGSKIIARYSVAGNVSPSGFKTVEITNLNVGSLGTASIDALLKLHSDGYSSLYNQFKTNTAITGITIYDADNSFEMAEHPSNADHWLYYTSTVDSVDLSASDADSPIWFAVKTFIPLLTDSSTAKIEVTYDAAGTTKKEYINLAPFNSQWL